VIRVAPPRSGSTSSRLRGPRSRRRSHRARAGARTCVQCQRRRRSRRAGVDGGSAIANAPEQVVPGVVPRTRHCDVRPARSFFEGQGDGVRRPVALAGWGFGRPGAHHELQGFFGVVSLRPATRVLPLDMALCVLDEHRRLLPAHAPRGTRCACSAALPRRSVWGRRRTGLGLNAGATATRCCPLAPWECTISCALAIRARPGRDLGVHQGRRASVLHVGVAMARTCWRGLAATDRSTATRAELRPTAGDVDAQRRVGRGRPQSPLPRLPRPSR
jgi:hypothetical protein